MRRMTMRKSLLKAGSGTDRGSHEGGWAAAGPKGATGQPADDWLPTEQ